MENNIINFTPNTIIKIETPKEKRKIYKDSKELGLILIVSYGGSKVFYLAKKIADKYYRIKIGNFPEVSIAEAREKAVELKIQITKGINPAEKVNNSVQEEVKNELSFKTLFDKYINDYAQYRIKRWKDIIADMNRQASHLYEKVITDITREDIQNIFNDLTKAKKFRAANVAVERFKRIFNKLVEWGFIEKNPINKNNVTLHREEARDRYLKQEEIKIFFNAVKEASPLIRDYIYISFYTAARKENVLSMSWKDINWKNQTWEIPNTKNGKPHVVPLLAPAIEILQKRRKEANCEWVFPSRTQSKTGRLQEPKKAWAKIIDEAGIKNFRIHDLRRTLASWMAMEGVSLHIISETLGHRTHYATRIYARLNIDSVRTSMQKALKGKMSIIQ